MIGRDVQGRLAFRLGGPLLTLAFLLALGVSWGVLTWIRGDYHTTPEFRHMQVREIVLLNDRGERVELKAHIADEPAEQLAGFQHIGRRVIAHSAILFVFDHAIVGRFHMRNVVAPLDIAFIAADGRVIAVMRMEPGTKLYGPDKPFQYALETAAGRLEAWHISAHGARLLPIAMPRGRQSSGGQ